MDSNLREAHWCALYNSTHVLLSYRQDSLPQKISRHWLMDIQEDDSPD